MWAAIQLFMIKNRWFSEDSVMSALGHFLPFRPSLAQRQLWSGKRTLVSIQTDNICQIKYRVSQLCAGAIVDLKLPLS